MDEAIIQRKEGRGNQSLNLLKECQQADTPSGGNYSKHTSTLEKRVESIPISVQFSVRTN